jgi:hypothetical protein
MDDAKVMMTVESPAAAPGLARAAEIIGVPLKALDRDFGVVPIDPERGLYAVMVREDAVRGRSRSEERPFSGPFSNPKIEAFGPPKK